MKQLLSCNITIISSSKFGLIFATVRISPSQKNVCCITKRARVTKKIKCFVNTRTCSTNAVKEHSLVSPVRLRKSTSRQQKS